MQKPPESVQDGFALRKILIAEHGGGTSENSFAQLGAVSLALPDTGSIEQLVEDRNIAARAEVDRINSALAVKDSDEESARKRGSERNNKSPLSNNGRYQGTNTFDLEFELECLENNFSEVSLLSGPSEVTRVQIMDWQEPLKLIREAESRSPDKETRLRDQALYKKLRELGAFREVAGTAELFQSIEHLAQIRDSHPNFAPVTDFIEGQLQLAIKLNKPSHIPPILLGGPPGVGKTHFSLKLADALGRTMYRHSLDAAHTASTLIGSSRHWSNTNIGLVFDTVCLGSRADPVILLDELDKATVATRDSKPLDPLHSLLEPVSACAVTDISAGITFNASYITWIATCNDLWRLPAPILSRFRVFDIQPPTAAQALDLAWAVAESVHARFASFDPPGKRITALLAHLTPREQIQVLEQSYASVLLNGRREIKVQDLPRHLRPDMHAVGESVQQLH